MAQRNVVSISCDRCNKTVVVMDEQDPSMFDHDFVLVEVISSPVSEGGLAFELCDKCLGHLNDFMNGNTVKKINKG